MVLTREGPEIFQCLVLALELLDPLLGLRGHVIFVDLQGAVSEECVVSHLLAFAAHRLSVEPFTPSSSDRSSTVIPPDGTAFAAAILNCLPYRFLLWVALNVFRS